MTHCNVGQMIVSQTAWLFTGKRTSSTLTTAAFRTNFLVENTSQSATWWEQQIHLILPIKYHM